VNSAISGGVDYLGQRHATQQQQQHQRFYQPERNRSVVDATQRMGSHHDERLTQATDKLMGKIAQVSRSNARIYIYVAR
jgi:hypothetical protein